MPALQKAGWNVVGIASRNRKQSDVIADRLGITAFDSWQELLRFPGLTALSIAVPQSFHKEIATAAIAAGKHVLCEKPFCLHLGDAQTLRVAAERAKLVHAINFEFREHPAIAYARRWIQEGKGGRVQSMTVSWLTGGWKLAIAGVSLTTTHPYKPLTVGLYLWMAAACLDRRLSAAWSAPSPLRCGTSGLGRPRPASAATPTGPSGTRPGGT